MKFSSSVLPLLGLCFAGSVVSAVGRGNSHNHNKGNSQNNAQNTDQGPYSADEISATDLEKMKAGTEANKGKGRVPHHVTLTTKNSNPHFHNNNGIPTADGELHVTHIGPDLSRVPVIKLQGLRQNPNQPVFFKQKDVDVPSPKFWKHESSSSSGKEERGEEAQVWYGEGVGQFKAASATLIASADGGIIGSVTDGTYSYVVKTAEEFTSKGISRKIKFEAVDLNDIPEDEEVDNHGTEKSFNNPNPSRHLSLRGTSIHESVLRGVQGKKMIVNEAMKGERELQEQCQDLFGYNGEWYDSDGGVYDCNWYGSQSSYCSSYGSGYSNFGFTANQACCVCGGGSTVNTVVDLLVAYTTPALNDEGGFNAMQNLISLSVFQTNIALSNSKTNVRIRHIESYHASDIIEPDTAERSDAHLLKVLADSQAVQNVRDRVGADLIGLICGKGNCVGRASNVGPYYDPKGMFVANRFRSALVGDYTFAHEVGHTLYACHDGDCTSNKSQGYGNCNQCFRTMMSYPRVCYDQGKCNVAGEQFWDDIPTQLYFSTPLATWNGFAVGDADHDNAASISKFAPTIAELKSAKAKSVQLCKHIPCESTPYFVPLVDGRIDMERMPDEIGNDHVSGIKVPAGFAIQWYQHNNFGGESWMNGHPTSDVTLDLSGFLSNHVSSFRVRKVTGKVKLYQHYDTSIGGSFECFLGAWPTMPTEVGNDQVSKIYIPKGYVITIYEHTNYGGWARTYKYDFNAMLTLSSSNDAISSFRVYLDWS